MAGKDSLREENHSVGAEQLIVLKGGSGKPLLVLHEELGYPSWMKWNETLSERRTLVTPLYPGFGRTPRAEWISNVRDLACFLARFVREQGMAPVDVIGFSLGGWLAAEMAANDPNLFSKVVLVAPVGIRPPEGEIMDLFRVPALVYLRESVRDAAHVAEYAKLYDGGVSPEQYEAFEDARAETARLAWQPYMFNPSLPHLLEGTVKSPTLIVWGRDDRVAPISAAAVYQKSIKGSRLLALEGCGHRPEIEKSEQFIKEVQSFLG
ncbi:MAG TPA: alpha/beta hydrolase [Candidatus Binataceae bacterium]|nr:alpha/beta hydrolase [Candidatus Binataceae bacterium]